MDIYNKLNEVFRDVFDNDKITVTAETTANDIDEWDSLSHISLIDAVENEFKVRFKMGEVSGMKNVGEMADIIQKRGKVV
jgi:acyl carrier protein